MIKKYISTYSILDSKNGAYSVVWYEEVDEIKKQFIVEKRLKSFKDMASANKWAERRAKKLGVEFYPWEEGHI